MVEGVSSADFAASIASLIDLSGTVGFLLQDIASKGLELRKAFHDLPGRFSLLIFTLRSIRQRLQSRRLPDQIVHTLQILITTLTAQINKLHVHLIPASITVDTPHRQQTAEALSDLAREGESRTVIEEIYEGIDLVVLHGSAPEVRSRDRASMDLANSQPAHGLSQTPQQGHAFPNVSTHDKSNVHLGDIYNFNYKGPEEAVSLGLCLSTAPQIDPNDFIGRAAELHAMRDIFHPGETPTEQQRLVLGGMGGVGKTQLAIAYARKYQRYYTSVFWLNATSELTLQASFRSLAPAFLGAEDLEKLDDKAMLNRIRASLCDKANTRWLLICDNYDEPNKFDMDNYCPNAGHGCIIITTRMPDFVKGRQVKVRPLKDINEGLAILQARSRRQNLIEDKYARLLAARLQGLPLALVTAGAYLRRSTITFQQYLQAYENRWHIDPRRPLRLQDYQDRTLFTTWNLSHTRLQIDDPDAALLLKLLAYFDNQEIWCKLIAAGYSYTSPILLHQLVSNELNLEGALGTLVEYCMVEVQPETQSYSMHNCVHDWAFAELNQVVDTQLYWYAIECVCASIGPNDWEILGNFSYSRLSRHALRLEQHLSQKNADFDQGILNHLFHLTYLIKLLSEHFQLLAAERMCTRVLAAVDNAGLPDNDLVLGIVHILGVVYSHLGRQDESERMYERALGASERTLGLEHTKNVRLLNDLGILYFRQRKLEKAQLTLERVVSELEANEMERNKPLQLIAIHNLGSLYHQRGRFDEAEKMLKRALHGGEATRGPENLHTLETVVNLGNLYMNQERYEEAMQMYKRALSGHEKALGTGHDVTNKSRNSLLHAYQERGMREEAEEIKKEIKMYSGP